MTIIRQFAREKFGLIINIVHSFRLSSQWFIQIIQCFYQNFIIFIALTEEMKRKSEERKENCFVLCSLFVLMLTLARMRLTCVHHLTDWHNLWMVIIWATLLKQWKKKRREQDNSNIEATTIATLVLWKTSIQHRHIHKVTNSQAHTPIEIKLHTESECVRWRVEKKDMIRTYTHDNL